MATTLEVKLEAHNNYLIRTEGSESVTSTQEEMNQDWDSAVSTCGEPTRDADFEAWMQQLVEYARAQGYNEIAIRQDFLEVPESWVPYFSAGETPQEAFKDCEM